MKIAEETHYLVRYPEEINIELEREKEIIRNNLEAEDSAIALEQAYCNGGLGTILMQKAIDKAREIGFEQMELGAYADNDRAIALYKKMGFQECGRTPKAFKLKDGTYIDEVNMILFL